MLLSVFVIKSMFPPESTRLDKAIAREKHVLYTTWEACLLFQEVHKTI